MCVLKACKLCRPRSFFSCVSSPSTDLFFSVRLRVEIAVASPAAEVVNIPAQNAGILLEDLWTSDLVLASFDLSIFKVFYSRAFGFLNFAVNGMNCLT